MKVDVEYICKGDWRLGTACGACQKCKLELPIYLEGLKQKVNNVQYIVIHNDGYDGSSIEYFDTRLEADNHLYNNLNRYIDDINYDNHISDYQLIEFTQQFDVRVAVEAFRQKRELIKNEALAKLSDTEKAVLGLTKA